MPFSPTSPPTLSIPFFRSHRYGHDPARYPIKAVPYVFSHASLWRTVFCVAFAGATIATIIIIALFVVTLKPQAQVISSSLEWWAWLIAVLLVLIESSIITSFLLVVAQSRAQTKIFVETMRLEKRWKDGQMVQQSTLKDFNILKKAFYVRMLTSPLQLIPLVGGALYSAINATFTGWDYMDRYFDAIRLSSRDQRVEVFGKERSDCSALFHASTYDSENDYARFGFMCAFLEAIPIVGWTIFPITNAVAAGLFACDIEASGGPICLRESRGLMRGHVTGEPS